MKKIFLITFLGSLLLFPLVSLAGTYKVDSKDVYYEGLVPCGIDKPLCDAPFEDGKCPGTIIRTKVGGEEHEGMPCQFCHFFVMFRGILDFVLKLVIVIGVLMLTIGGFMFLFAGGSPALLDRAKSILTSTVIGLVIIFAAWMIINTIFMAIGVAKWTNLKEGWFSIECPITPFVEKEKEDYQKKITATEEEIGELEEEIAGLEEKKEKLKENITAAARDQNIDWLKELNKQLDDIDKQLDKKTKQIEETNETWESYQTELANLEKTQGEEPAEKKGKEVEKEEKEKPPDCGDCGAGLHICNKKQCEALGTSEKPCQYTPAKFQWGWDKPLFSFSKCEPK